jgi:thiamine-monophosphate kinase
MPRLRQTENSLLAKISRGFRSSDGGIDSRAETGTTRLLSLGIGDDAALFQPTRGCETILTCDWFLEGTHFLRDKHPPDAVGWKSLARAVSDIAAMGGTPRCFLLSLALPESATGSWLAKFLRGLRRAALRFDCVLAGGDTTKRNEILINITVVGEVQSGRALHRDGANAGDLLYVSGRLGEAEQGLRLLRKDRDIVNRSEAQLRKHLYPEPRLALGQWLVTKRLATAAMDLSDGLSSDLPRLCEASGVGARIDAQKLPRVNPLLSTSPARRKTNTARENEALALVLHGGDDYELLFTVPRNKASRVPASFEGVPLTAIGEITASRKILLGANGHIPTTLKPAGWDPFR